jgi:ketosteroid isomerase-like protein
VDPTRFAEALSSLLERGDASEIESLFASKAMTWHNTDHRTVDARANHARVATLLKAVSDPKVEVVAASSMEDALVLQFIYSGTVTSTGTPFEMHNCIVARCDADGQIERIDEYVDASARVLLAPSS